MQRRELESNGYDTSNSAWRAVQDWATCLKEAFLASQADLLRLAASEGLQLSGSMGRRNGFTIEAWTATLGESSLLAGPSHRHQPRSFGCSRDSAGLRGD